MIIEQQNGNPVLICDTCKKIRSFRELEKGSGASFVFVPESDAPTIEENRFRCAACTKEFGKDLPSQNVVVDRCSGIY